MGIAERKERDRQRRRNDILDAAERLLVSKDFDAVTMDDVAQAAELSKGTLYLYFKSKEEIYLSVNVRALERMRECFEEAAAGETRGIDKVRAIGETYLKFSRVYPDYSNAVLRFEARRPGCLIDEPMARECHDSGVVLLKILEGAISDGISDGSIRPDVDPAETSVLLWALTDGIIRVIVAEGEHLRACHNLDPQGLLDAYFQLMYAALVPYGETTSRRS